MVYPLNSADTANAPGSGACTLLGVVPSAAGFASFLTLTSRLANGDVGFFMCVDSTDKTTWEIFRGTYTTSGTSLARTATIITSAGNSTPLNFANAVNIYAVDPSIPYSGGYLFSRIAIGL